MHNGGGGLVAKSCPTLETLWTVCSLPGFSVHRILQARILQWLPFPSPGCIMGRTKRKEGKKQKKYLKQH